MRNGFFAGAGVDWSAKSGDRDDIPGFGDSNDKTGDKFGWQFRIGYHPGVNLPPAPVAAAPPPPLPPPPVAPPQHVLSVKAQCDPCTVQVGQTSTVTAIPQSSIGCVVTYAWTAPTGSFANAAAAQTVWTAPNQVGTVPVTVTVTCPTDKLTASANVQIQVIAAPVRTFTLEDVYFDFDRFSLTEAAMRVLGEAVTTLRANPNLRIRIEGNTCNIGTAEYNLALGERRGQSVRQYLVSNGIAADRLQTISYGEEMPKFDNAREETRRLNRRAALTVQIVQ
jgi:outer membrane protein OmpA-like peptidoglycan-associated protein